LGDKEDRDISGGQTHEQGNESEEGGRDEKPSKGEHNGVKYGEDDEDSGDEEDSDISGDETDETDEKGEEDEDDSEDSADSEDSEEDEKMQNKRKPRGIPLRKLSTNGKSK
jgi:hypothetical protein